MLIQTMHGSIINSYKIAAYKIDKCDHGFRLYAETSFSARFDIAHSVPKDSAIFLRDNLLDALLQRANYFDAYACLAEFQPAPPADNKKAVNLELVKSTIEVLEQFIDCLRESAKEKENSNE